MHIIKTTSKTNNSSEVFKAAFLSVKIHVIYRLKLKFEKINFKMKENSSLEHCYTVTSLAYRTPVHNDVINS